MERLKLYFYFDFILHSFGYIYKMRRNNHDNPYDNFSNLGMPDGPMGSYFRNLFGTDEGRTSNQTRSPFGYESGSHRTSRFDSRTSRNHDRSRSPLESRNPVPDMNTIREGAVFTHYNFYNFLNSWVDLFSNQCRKSRNLDLAGEKELVEIITPATPSEKSLLILPDDLTEIDRNNMVHCDLTIIGLPSAIFFGSGYGVTPRKAKYAASKDLANKFHRAGIFSELLHQSIIDREYADADTYKTHIKLSLRAAIVFREKMSAANLRGSIMNQRMLDNEHVELFRNILGQVVVEVYGNPKSEETIHSHDRVIQELQMQSDRDSSLIESTSLYQNNRDTPNSSSTNYSLYNTNAVDNLTYNGPSASNQGGIQMHQRGQNYNQMPNLNNREIQMHQLNQPSNQTQQLNQSSHQMHQLNQMGIQMHNMSQGSNQIQHLHHDSSQMHQLNQGGIQIPQSNQGSSQMHQLNQGGVQIPQINQGSNQMQQLNQTGIQLQSSNQTSNQIEQPKQRSNYMQIVNENVMKLQQKELRRMENEANESVNKAAMNLESLMMDFRSIGRVDIVETISASSTYKSLQNLNSMDVNEKKQLTIDIFALIKCYSLMMEGSSKGKANNYSKMQENTENEKIKRFQLGDLKLRTVLEQEIRSLKKGTSLIAQDDDGRYKLVSLDEIKDNFALLNCEGKILIKPIEEVYIEETSINGLESVESIRRYWDTGEYEFTIKPLDVRAHIIDEYRRKAERSVKTERITHYPRDSKALVRENIQKWNRLPKADNLVLMSLTEGEKEIVFKNVASLMDDFAAAFNTKIEAHILKVGLKRCVAAYFEKLPFLVFSGRFEVKENVVDPPISALFSAYRLNFLPSVRRIIPVPIFQKILRNVDTNQGLDWNRRFVRSDEFQQMANRAIIICTDDAYACLDIEPHRYDSRDAYITRKRGEISDRLIEASKQFWTYEKMKIFLGAIA